jgi:hypothetical protein
MLYYDYAKSISASAGAYVSKQFSANGLYDPDISGVGHQPSGFDQMMLFYEHYAVFASAITFRIWAWSGSAPGVVGAMLNPTNSSLASAIRTVENGFAVTKTIGSQVGGWAGGYNTIKEVTLKCDVVKYFGKKNKFDLLDDEKMTGDSANNPAEQVYFDLFQWGLDASSTVDLVYDVTINYDVIFFEPRKLTSS